MTLRVPSPPPAPRARAFVTDLRRTGHTDFTGLAVDRHDEHRIWAIDILVDDIVFATLRADRRLPGIAEGQAGDIDHGFAFSLPDAVVREAEVVQARLANLDLAVGTPIRLNDPFGCLSDVGGPGEVAWLGGLHVTGWVRDADLETLSILVDGVLVDRVRPTAWRTDGADGMQTAAVRAFAVHLPMRFADGLVHHCAVLTAHGEELRGSPLAILAFEDGLRGSVVGQGASDGDLLRAALFDRLMPLAIPFAAYDDWRPSPPPGGQPDDAASCAVILIGAKSVAAESIDSLRGQTQCGWVAAALPALAGPTGFEPASLRRVLDDQGRGCSIVVFALAGTLLQATALQSLTEAFSACEGAVAVYADLEMQEADGSLWPLALSAFDYERLLEQGYCTLFFALRREAVDRALSAGARDLPRLFNAVLDETSDAHRAVVHVPRILAMLPSFDRTAAGVALAASSLAHLRRRGIDARAERAVPGVLPAVRIRRTHANPKTTIIIPTRNRRDLLEACVTSILPAARRHNADLLIVDNETSDPDTLGYLRHLESTSIDVMRVSGPFNFARLINRGAQAARGELLCLLNNDVVAQDADWLDELLGRMSDSDVGAVAPMLVWPSHVVQHGGLVLGPRFEAAHAFTDRLDTDAGYADLLRVAHETSALTAACLLTRRRDYLDLGGMDELHFPINFNDVDYCLKLREAGRRIVFTPHAKLVHPESSSRGHAWSADRRALFDRERRRLRLKWGRVIADDPYYSPLLSLDPYPFSGLASPVRAQDPRLNLAPVSRDVPDGF